MAVTRCTFLHVFPSFEPGGMEVRAARILDRLSQHRHLVLAMSGKTGCVERLAHAAVEIVSPPPAGGMVRTARRLAATLRQIRPDLVLTYNWGAIETVAACRLAGIHRLVHHEEGFGADEVLRPLRRRAWLRRLLLGGRSRAVVVVPSQRLRELVTSIYKVPAARVRWLPNGVDLHRFVPRPPVDGRVPTIGTVAHFRPEKDVPALVAAFARCAARDGARLLLVGDGPQRPAIEQAIAAHGLAGRVELRGSVADTSAVYREFDVFALSSRTEQMPLVVLEAMACGLPVVAPRVGDVARMVSADNAAWLAPPGDVAALAAALDAALGDAAMRQRTGAANRARCEADYEQDACLRRHVALHEEILGQRLE